MKYIVFTDFHQKPGAKEEGVEIGNHPHSHDYFVNYSPVELIENLILILTLVRPCSTKRQEGHLTCIHTLMVSIQTQ